MPKYLRIAVTALSLMACVLLIALWVRSSKWTDKLASRTYFSDGFILDSADGHIGFYYPSTGKAWRRSSVRTVDDPVWEFTKQIESNWDYSIIVPHWSFILVCATFAAAPWMRLLKCFSLRTLLIAFALFAVLLGYLYVVR
jgi:hypothetical protein